MQKNKELKTMVYVKTNMESKQSTVVEQILKISIAKNQEIFKLDDVTVIRDHDSGRQFMIVDGDIWICNHGYAITHCATTEELLMMDIVDYLGLDLSLQQTAAACLMGQRLTKPQRALDNDLDLAITEASDICKQVGQIKNCRSFTTAEEKLSKLEAVKDDITVCCDRLTVLKRKIQRLARYHKHDESTCFCDFYRNALESISSALYSLSCAQTEVRCMIIACEFEIETGEPLDQQTFRSDETGFDVTDNRTGEIIVLFSAKTLTLYDMRDGHKHNIRVYTDITDALLNIENNLKFQLKAFPDLNLASEYALSVWVNRMIELTGVN